jgi:ADP-heptose:LPS heptosyltransferase
VTRIAVLRANRVGDLVFVLPALAALRERWPDAELVLLGCRWHAGFLAGRPGPVDRVEVVPPSEGVNTLDGPPAGEAELEAWFARRRDEGFDLAVQLHGGGRFSNPFVARLGAARTAGLRAEDASGLDVEVPYVYWQSEVLRALEVTRALGCPPVDPAPALAVTEADRADAAAHAPSVPYAVLCPGASDGRRRWPPERFAAVGDALAADGLRVLVTGSADERAVVGAVVAGMDAPADALAGAVSLGGLLALLAGAAVVVTNDSGPLHLAGAAGTPTVGVYWAGNVINGAPPFRAGHRPLLSFRTACPRCGADCMAPDGGCDHDDSFVADVPAADAVAAARALTARAPVPA